VFKLEQLDFLLLKYSAVGESLAAALLAQCAKGARVPIAKAMYANLVRDEVHHARLGWYYFQWRAPQWSLTEKQQLADRIAEFVVEIEQEFWWGRDAPAAYHDAAVALGVLDTERQRLVIKQVMEEELVPALDALGLGGSHAWRVRRRGSAESLRRAASFVVTPTVVTPTSTDSEGAIDRAAGWLARQIDADGHLHGCRDVRGESATHGEMPHGRAAVVLSALRAHGGHAAAAAGLALYITTDLQAADDGQPPAGWPVSAWMAAGTYALACLGGLPFYDALLRHLEALPREPPHAFEAAWHAGQIATALGTQCPEWIWLLCKQPLAAGVLAPWSARAASVRDDRVGWSVGRDALVAWLQSIDPATPNALVAAALEALECDTERDDHAALAIKQGRAHLHAAQLGDDAGAGAGAFAISAQQPLLRVDVTAHALLALIMTESWFGRG
jgi:hypothetical protein